MFGKIKQGALISQDHRVLKWPNCCPPEKEYIGEEYQYRTKNPDMIFEIEKDQKDWYECSADGYGFLKEKGEYGNGSITVFNIYDIEIVDHV